MAASANTQISWEVTIPIKLACYPREVIYRTCYAFTDRAYLWLEPGTDDEVLVRLARKSEKTELAVLQGEFGNSLIDFALRRQVSDETRTIREALVRAAFNEILPS